MQWHFQPAMKDGKPIESYARVPVNSAWTNSPGAMQPSQSRETASERSKNTLI